MSGDTLIVVRLRKSEAKALLKHERGTKASIAATFKIREALDKSQIPKIVVDARGGV